MHIIFLCLAAVLTVGTTVLLVLPLLRTQKGSDERRGDERQTLYKRHLAELDEERAAQAISEEQYRQSRDELARRIIEETKIEAPSPRLLRWTPSARAIALGLIVGLPLGGFSLYGMLGNQAAVVLSATPAGDIKNPEYDHQTTVGLDALTARLSRRLADDPNDGQGWALLARSYLELGRHIEAAEAFEKAAQIVPDDAQLLVDYADALAVAKGRKLDGRPQQLISRALQIDPRNIKGHMLAGTVAYEHKDWKAALSHWEKAQKELPAEAESELRQELSTNVNEVRGLLGLAPTEAAPTSSRSMGPSGSVSTGGDAPAITGTVTIAPALKAKLSSTDALFVFARSVNGPPMPVAIMRGMARDLPFTFRLDDSMSPMPARKLSEAGEVTIIARLSRSGQATPQRGDLQGTSRPVRPGAHDLQISIDSELP